MVLRSLRQMGEELDWGLRMSRRRWVSKGQQQNNFTINNS
jgi:hypothetical protein